MTKTEIRRALQELPPSEQLEIAEEVWERVSPPEGFELTPELKDLLDARLQDAIDHPERSIPWETVKERLFADL